MTERRQSPFDWMQPAERLERVIELLALGAIRAAQNPAPPAATLKELPASSIPLHFKRGRIPFGQQKTSSGRISNHLEGQWLKLIEDLAAKGFSSEEIAKHLNKKDLTSSRAGKWSRTAVWRILQKPKKKTLQNDSVTTR